MRDGQTGPAILRAFQQNDCEVVVVDPHLQAGELFQICNEHDGKFDFCLVSRTVQLFDQIQKIKMAYPKLKTAVWNPDVREKIEHWGELIQLIVSVDYYFTVGEGVVDRWKEIQPNSFWLPQGIQDEIYHRPKGVFIKEHDVGFIGGLLPKFHKNRIGVLAEMQFSDLDFHWYQNVYNEEHNLAVQGCNINLGCSMLPKVKNYWSVRNWKVIAAGGVLIDQERPGMKNYFQGKIETYKNGDDCVKVCKKILQNYEKYQTKADELCEWAMAGHTYTNRIKKMLEIVA